MGDQKEKLFNIYFFIIAFVNLGSSTMMQMFNSTITLHIDALDYAASVSGTLISIGAVSATVYRFFGGKLCEKRGRRTLIILGLADFAFMSLLMGIVDELVLLYILRILQMFGYSMASTSVSVAIIDVIPQKRVGEGLGYYSLAASLPQAFGPSVALFLYHMKGGFGTVMAGAALMGLIALILTVLFLDYEKKRTVSHAKRPNTESALQKNALEPETALQECVSEPEPALESSMLETEGKKTPKGIWKFIEKRALPAAWVYFFVMISGSLVSMYLTLYASKTGIDNAGWFFTISVIFMVAARLSSGRLCDRMGVLYAVVPGILSVAAGFVLLLLCSRVTALFYIAGAFYGFGTGMTAPALNAQAVREVPKDRVSIASSTFFLPVDISFMAGSVLWGVMIDHFSFSVIFVTAAGLSAAALLLSLIMFLPRKSAGR